LATTIAGHQPLQSLDEWDDFVASRYRQGKSEEEFRQYSPDANPGVAEFYRQNHAGQTVDFVRAKRAEYLKLDRGRASGRRRNS
jgi:inositol oxygenase